MANSYTASAILHDRQRLCERRQTRYPAAGALLQLTMNIPGPDKRLPAAYELFGFCMKALEEALASAAYPVLALESMDLMIGPVAYLQAGAEAAALKQLCLSLEQKHPLSAYWDMDVYTPSGQAVGRRELGAPSRRCYLCSQPAKVCGALGRHSPEELLGRLTDDLDAFRQAQNEKQAAKKGGLELVPEAKGAPSGFCHLP
ncbi:citrate lyase holo-[acyl-carrier protein] synthase [Paenibacillus piscarius]|uniref:citrate lyase holo-[acyl-carrier protein] synthase n=1 Tax=Paenibacillus piscarius TaxID=1089681 RepID=UPI00308433DA